MVAQTTNTLHGQVLDPLGLLVAHASVDLLNGPIVLASTSSDGKGEYTFALHNSGRYQVRVSAPGFQTTSTAPVYLSGSSDASIDVTLTTATLTQQITVTATGTPTPEAQTGASVTVLSSEEYRYMPEVQDPLRLVPGTQVTQTGEMGGTSGLSIRGGETDANKVLIDGVPANQIGGGVEFANLASVGVQSIEVLREPNSALYGSDALAGVVSLTSVRGTTRLPLITYAGDGGNFGTYRNEVTAGVAIHHFDAYSAFARIDTRNNIPNSEFHNATSASNFGWTPNLNNDFRFTVRHIAVSGGQPNAIALYGIPDDAQQKEQDNYYSAIWNNETTAKWHNQIRYGGLRLKGEYNSFGATGIEDPNSPGYYDGAEVTVKGANGYVVSGQAQFQYSDLPSEYISKTNRDFVYAQTDYRVTPNLVALGAFKYESESGSSAYEGSPATEVQRGNYSYTVQLAGDMRNRLFYNVGSGLEDNGLFGFAATPRASLAYYLVRPTSSRFFSGTKLHGTFGKGIKEPSVYQQANSLYGTLTALPDGVAIADEYNVTPLGAENARTYDAGVDQQLASGRARVGITYFHNEFDHGVEYVPPAGLEQLGVPAASLPSFQYVGAYLNSFAFRSQGIEFEAEYRLTDHLFARGGYTYTDAKVQHSFSSDNLGASYNTSSNFGDIPIGAYSPLVGARPFRVAPHSGYFALNYTQSRFYGSLTGTLVGKRDDSDFLCDNTISYGCGTSLLLPNRNLLGGYERLELGGGYQLNSLVSIYADAQNLLSQHYFEAFGYPALPLTFRSGIKLRFGGESWKVK
jgi:iron complex outermembrane receptor protein/vitamin B12 transporter